MSDYDWREHSTTEELIESAGDSLSAPYADTHPLDSPPLERLIHSGREATWTLLEVVRRQQAQIAALEAARAPHGPPLEGTGPLPLERRGE